MIRVREAIVVEGRYDANTLRQIVRDREYRGLLFGPGRGFSTHFAGRLAARGFAPG